VAKKAVKHRPRRRANAWSSPVSCSVFGGLWSVSDRENTPLHGLARDGPLWRWFDAGEALALPIRAVILA